MACHIAWRLISTTHMLIYLHKPIDFLDEAVTIINIAGKDKEQYIT